MEPKFAAYLKGFVSHSAVPADGATRVFLSRNFPEEVRTDSATVPQPPAAAELVNGLECKVNCATSKVGS